MNNLTMKVEVIPGTDVSKAAEQAVALANRIGIAVEYNFNGVTCWARPGGDYEKLSEACYAKIGSNEKHKFATA